MYQPPQNRKQVRLFGVSGPFLNAAFLLIIAGVIAGISGWLLAFGGVDSVERSADQVESEIKALVPGSDSPTGAVIVPDTWATYDPSRDSEDQFRAALAATHPDFAHVMDGPLAVSGNGLELSLVAFDRAAPVSSPTTFNMLSQHIATSTEIAAQGTLIQRQLSARGHTIVSMDSALTIGGFPAGRYESRFDDSGIRLAGVQYVILPEPDIAFIMTFVTTEEHFATASPTFEQIAGSFVLTDE